MRRADHARLRAVRSERLRRARRPEADGGEEDEDTRTHPQIVPQCDSGAWPLSRAGTTADMDDDDDWVGTPPEGHITRDRANPGFWAGQKPLVAGGGVLLLIVIVVLAIALSQ